MASSPDQPIPAALTPEPRIDLTVIISHVLRGALSAMQAAERAPEWCEWAQRWLAGERSPQRCVDVAHRCFADGYHALGQLSWAAKEAYYASENPLAAWYVIRYVADAAIALAVPIAQGELPSPSTIATTDQRALLPPPPTSP